MAIVARILGLSLLTSGLGAGIGYVLCGKEPGWPLVSFLLACVGGIVGAIAGAAREIVAAQRPRKAEW